MLQPSSRQRSLLTFGFFLKNFCQVDLAMRAHTEFSAALDRIAELEAGAPASAPSQQTAKLEKEVTRLKQQLQRAKSATASSASASTAPAKNAKTPQQGPRKRTRSETAASEPAKKKSKGGTEEKRFKCPGCEQMFARTYDMKRHYKSHHAKGNNDAVPDQLKIGNSKGKKKKGSVGSAHHLLTGSTLVGATTPSTGSASAAAAPSGLVVQQTESGEAGPPPPPSD
jgi:uncharacterized C2H2 Zn-finger protein